MQENYHKTFYQNSSLSAPLQLKAFKNPLQFTCERVHTLVAVELHLKNLKRFYEVYFRVG